MDFDLEASGKDSDGESDTDADVLLAHRAAAQGEINLLVQAIQQDPSVLEQEDAEGYTPLAHAVQAQQMGAVKRLVKMGANTNAQDSQGRTCLSVAAYQGWYDGVVYLLRNGAKQNIPDKSGRTPLHASTYDKDTRIIGALLQVLTREEANQADNEKMSALHWSAFHNRPEHAQMLVLRGADICCQDVDGKTPLHWAAQNGSASCCHILIRSCSSGTDLVNLQDSSGKSAIHYAVAAGHSEVLQELATVQGCELEAEDPDDRTPLHWAAAMGHPQCVSVLLKLGVTPDPLDVEGGTPLDYARQSGHSECQIIMEERLGIKSSPVVQDKKKTKKTSDSNPFKIRRNPIGVLKDLFRPKHKKTAGNPLSNDSSTSELVEMTTIVHQDSSTNKSKSNRQKSIRNDKHKSINSANTADLNNSLGQKLNGDLLISDKNASEHIVPKITLSSYDVDGILNANEEQKKPKKSKKTLSEELAPPGRYDNIQSIGSRVSPMLPPVMAPRISPLPPITPVLPDEPPPRKRTNELAPLRVPKGPSGSNVLINDKVAALRKEKEGCKNRSPTPPLNIWAQSDKINKKHLNQSPRPAPSPLINDTTPYSENGIYKKKLQQNTSHWLQVDDQDKYDLHSASLRSRSGVSLTSSSSVSIASEDSEVRKLSSLQDYQGYSSHTSFREAPRMTAMEKKALDRTIQSLLH